MTVLATEAANPVADLRRSLIGNGYTPVPVVTGDKMPRLHGWQKLTPQTHDVDRLIADYPDHMSTGLLTGGLVAIDVDVLDEDAAKAMVDLVAMLPGYENALARQGQAPKTLFLFRATEARTKVATPEYVVAGKKAQVEVMGSGQQVVGFGDHPVTERPYEWLGDSPLDVPFAGLPEITPAQITDFLVAAEAVLAEHGTIKKKATPVRAQASGGGETFWQRVNSASLANLAAWVPDTFSQATVEAGTGAWRVSSASLGRSLQEDISIHPSGIQDFGEERPETAISLVQKYGSASSPKDAAHWLCQRLGILPEDLGWETPPSAFSPLLGAMVAANDNDDRPSLIPAASKGSSGLSEEMCYPPGAVGEFARYITSCSRFPSPQLSLVSAIAFTAALVGRRYKGPTGLRSNVYVIGLAESGVGKDVTIRVPARIADSTARGEEVSKKIIIDKPSSMQGLARALQRSPASYAVIDEFGHWLGRHTGRNVAPHKEEIVASLMELTGATMGAWGGQERATGNIARVKQPCLTIHGISTPSTFWGALSSGNISEGLLGRLILIDAGTSTPKKVRRPVGSLEDIPPDLTARVHALLGGGAGKFSGGQFYALSANGDEVPFPIMTVEYGDGAEDEFEDFDDAMRARKSKVDAMYAPILNRVGENAAKLALIVAVGIDHRNPVITVDVQRWANQIAEASFNTLIRGADDNIADNDRSKEYLRVRDLIGKEHGDGITLRILTRRLRGGIDTRRFEDILRGLRTAGEAHLAKRQTSSGQWQVRYWKAEYLPEDAEILPLE